MEKAGWIKRSSQGLPAETTRTGVTNSSFGNSPSEMGGVQCVPEQMQLESDDALFPYFFTTEQKRP